MTDQRVVLIGIDGADWSFLDGWIADGHLPNIAKLVDGGVRASLNSVKPLNSAAAWTSIVTGRDPGGHGVFGFAVNSDGAYRRSPVKSSDVKAATLWEIVNAVGQPAGVINCPITYPPPALDGFLVSGILIPHNDLWAHPPELENKLRGMFGPYIVDVPWAAVDETNPGDREDFISKLYTMMRKREEVTIKCATEFQWRVMAVFFTGTDRILHRFFHYTDPRHPLYDQEAANVYGNEIRKYFTLVDEVVGRIIEKVEGARIIIVSDHGFGPLYFRFNLRAWLRQKGFLVEGHADGAAFYDEALNGVDLSKSKVFPSTLSESGIWINLKGRQPTGIVGADECESLKNRIIGELENFETEDGHRPVRKVFRREDILSGAFVEDAPDLLVEAEEKYIVDDSDSENMIDISPVQTGDHRPAGIFIANGDGVKSGVRSDSLRAADVLPTLLAAAGLPAPVDLEGKAAVGIFEKTPAVETCPPIEPGRVSTDGSGDEDESRRKLLKGLGYI